MNSLTDALKNLSADGTGVNLEVLRGQQNFNRWARDFQAVSQAKGVWDAITGNIVHVDPPAWTDYYSTEDPASAGTSNSKEESPDPLGPEGDKPKKKSRKSGRQTLGPEEIKQLVDGKASTKLDIQTALALYKFDLDAYDKYEKKTDQAMALLVSWVDPIIRGKLQTFTQPYLAWEYLKEQYKMSDVRAQEIAMNQFERIHMSHCKNVQEYLNEIEKSRQDIIDAGGHCDEAMVTSKIIRGLTASFHPFVDQYHFLRDLDTAGNAFDLGKLTTRLLTFESDLQQRTNNKTVLAVQGKFIRRNTNLKCETCGKTGHSEDRCWTTHPELKKSPEEFRAWKKNQDQKKGSAIRTPDRVVAITKVEQTDQKPKRFAAMAQTNLKKFHHHLGACEFIHATSITKADPYAQAEGDKPRYKGIARTDEQGGDDGGSRNGKGSYNSVAGVQHQFSSAQSDTFFARSPSIQSMMLTQNGDQSVRRDDWILDGGANTHVVNSKEWFTEFYDFSLEVATADDGNVLEIQGGGSVELHLTNSNGDISILELSKVAYAPNVRCNILSQSALGQFGNLRGLWDKKGITIETEQGETVAEATEREGMYYLNVKKLTQTAEMFNSPLKQNVSEAYRQIPILGGSSPKETSTQVMPYGAKPPLVVAAINFNDPVWKWHRRLGHLSFENMRRLAKVSRGMNITEKQIKAKLNAICPVCATSRAINRIPREPATRKFEGIGDMIHADTWGPYGLSGIDGIKFFLALTDDAMRFTWAEPFKVKSEIGPLFRKMLTRIETVYKTKVRIIRGDNEMFENDTVKWCEQRGIQLEPAVPFAHHQNGVAERNFRTERERTAAMLQEHTLPKRTARIIEGLRDDMLRNCTAPERLWPEAWKHAVWLKNRTPTRALKSRKTPFELVTGHPPDLRRERIWGSRTYVTVPPERRGPKLHEPRGWLGYFMGSESESVYRIWNPEKNKVMRISVARVEDGEGMDDEQDEPSRQNRVLDSEFSPNDNLGEEQEESDSGESEYEPLQENIHEEERQNRDTTELSDEERSTNPSNKEQAGDQNQSDEQPLATEDELFIPHDRPDSQEQNTDHSSSEVSENDPRPKSNQVSPYFSKPEANMVKRSIHNEDETDQPQRKATKQPQDSTRKRYQDVSDKCKVCAKEYRTCDGTYPFLDKCSNCAKRHRTCETQEAPERPKPQRTTAPGVKASDKCKYCFKYGKKCNGEEPCSTCIKRKRICETQDAPDRGKRQSLKVRCRQCRDSHQICDLKEPCLNCRVSGKECDYGTELKRHKVDRTADRCNCCKVDNLACTGGKPCTRCKKKNQNCKWKDGDSETIYTHGRGRELWERYAENPNSCIECQQWCPTVIGSPQCDGELPCGNCVRRNQGETETAVRGKAKGYIKKTSVSNHTRCRYTRPDGSIKRVGLHKTEKLQERLRGYAEGVKASKASKHIEDEIDSESDVTDDDLIALTNDNIEHEQDVEEEDEDDEDEDKEDGDKRNDDDDSSDEDNDDTQGGDTGGKAREDQDPSSEHDNNHFDPEYYGDGGGYRLGNDLGNDCLPPGPTDRSTRDTDQGGVDYSDLYSASKDDSLSGGVGNLSLLEDGEDLDKDQSFFSTVTAEEQSELDNSTADITDNPHWKNVYSIQDAPQTFKNLTGWQGNEWTQCWERFQNTDCAVCLAEMALDPEPNTRREALRRPDAQKWQSAMQDEYDSLIQNNTWTIVNRPTDQHVLSTRWVLRRKLGPDGQIAKYKARHVVRGYEQIYGIDFDETFASVVKQPSYRMLFALQAQFGWVCHQMDVKTAFLHGEVEEDIFTEPPDGFPENPGKVLKLNKALYGLKQAPRQWYKCLTKTLIRLGWTVLESDSSVFKHPKGLFLTIWVDDLNLFGADEREIIAAKQQLVKEFEMTDLGECAYYLGMHVVITPDATYLHQAGYIQQMLNRFKLNDVALSKTPTSPHRKLYANKGETASRDFVKEYQAKVGSVNYSATITRPDTSFAVSRLARYMSNPSDEHMKEMHVLFGYLKGTMFLAIKYNRGDAQISRGLVDSDYGGCPDTYRSTTGWVFLLAGAPVSWSSKRQKTVAMSSCEAEYVAASEATKEAMWLRRLLKELIGVHTLRNTGRSYTLNLEIDNNSAMKLSKNPEFHARSKHIAIRHHFIREQIADGAIALQRIDTANNLADILTKGLPRPRFEELVRKLGMHECPRRSVILDRGSVEQDENR